MRAVRVHRTGAPDVLTVDEVTDPDPGPGEVRVRVEAAGLNFIDTYHRRGLYDLELPATLGVEGAGTVDVVGEGVGRVVVGDRVGWTGAIGSYAELVVVPVEQLVLLPDDVSADTAAAVLLQGMTAHYLSHTTYPVSDGETCLVLAAAGGVGHLLVQLAAGRGARVLATVSSDEKERLARQDGADEVIRYTETDLVAAVAELTDGHGVDVVYDSVGQDTFAASLDCLRPRGYLVLYGQSSGPVEPVDPQVLNRKGSLFLTRPTLGDYVARPEELRWRSGDLFDRLGAGTLRVRTDRTFALDDAAAAHRHIEGRRTTGKVLLRP